MKTAHVRTAFVAAPLSLLLGVLGMKLGWKGNPDLEWTVALPLWTAAHLAYIIGNLLMLVVLATLWTRTRTAARSAAERGAAAAVTVVGAIGTVAMTGQMVIDLVVGFRAGARSEMSPISRSIHDLPGFEIFFHGLVPALGLAAVAVLALAAAFRRQMPVWTAIVFLVASLCIGTGITALMIAGGAVACVALPAMVRGDRAPTTPPTSRVAVGA